MVSPNSGRAVRALIAIGMLLALLTVLFSVIPSARAGTAVQPFYQDTSYPGETITAVPTNVDTYAGPATSVPGASNTPTATVTVQPAGLTTPTPAATLTELITVTASPTRPDVFRTEDAEMGGSQVTPPVLETTETDRTITPTPTATATPYPTVFAGQDQSGFRMDWGMFWVGFALPVLLACGLVLYLLDRWPELFSLRK